MMASISVLIFSETIPLTQLVLSQSHICFIRLKIQLIKVCIIICFNFIYFFTFGVFSYDLLFINHNYKIIKKVCIIILNNIQSVMIKMLSARAMKYILYTSSVFVCGLYIVNPKLTLLFLYVTPVYSPKFNL